MRVQQGVWRALSTFLDQMDFYIWAFCGFAGDAAAPLNMQPYGELPL